MNLDTFQWTKPYYGVQHYAAAGDQRILNTYWATVNDLGSCATSHIRTPAGELPEKTHASAEEARAHVERVLRSL